MPQLIGCLPHDMFFLCAAFAHVMYLQTSSVRAQVQQMWVSSLPLPCSSSSAIKRCASCAGVWQMGPAAVASHSCRPPLPLLPSFCFHMCCTSCRCWPVMPQCSFSPLLSPSFSAIHLSVRLQMSGVEAQAQQVAEEDCRVYFRTMTAIRRKVG